VAAGVGAATVDEVENEIDVDVGEEVEVEVRIEVVERVDAEIVKEGEGGGLSGRSTR